MIYGTHSYGQFPAVLKKLLPEHAQHEYVPKKEDTPLQTMLHDHGMTAFNIAGRVLKGAALGLLASYAGYQFKVADKKILTDRVHNDWKIYLLRRAKLNVAIGALAGLAWYVIYDQLLCPHGQATFYKNLLAHSVAGSLLFMAFWNPSVGFYGGLFGALIGLKNEMLSIKVLPKDVEIEFGHANPEARQRAIHDEIELELSTKLLKSRDSLKNSIPL